MRTLQRRPRSFSLGVVALLVTLVCACSKQTADGFIASAQRRIASNEFGAAQIELRNAIKEAPDDGLAHELLGTTLLRTGDAASAEVVLRRALKLKQTPERILPALALALLRLEQPQKVIDEFRNTELQDAKAHASLRASVGHAWVSRGDLNAAREAFAAAQVAQPGDASALLGLARIAAHEAKPDEAMVLVDSALKNNPGFAEAYAFKGQLLVSSGRQPQAIHALEQALASDSGFLPARLALASILIGSKDYGSAKKVLAESRAASGDPRVHFMRSLLALRQGDLQQARERAAAALKAAPEYDAALALAGEIELRSGNFALAEQHLQRSLTLQPTHDVRRLLAATQLRQGRAAAALKTLEPVLLEDGVQKDASVLLLAGEAHLANGDVHRAAEYFESAKAAASTEAPARTRLGQLALQAGDPDRGERELLAASAKGIESVEPDLLLVSLYLRRHDLAKALAAAKTLIQKQPQNPVGHVLAGTVLVAERREQDARQSFKAALKLKPDHVPALRAIAELDIAQGRTADALKRFEAQLAQRPNDEQLLLATAALEEATGRGDPAVTLRKALTANPSSRAPVFALVQYQLRRKMTAAALEVAQSAAMQNPDDTDLAILLSIAQEAAGARRDAIRTLNAAAARDPKGVAPLTRLAQMQVRRGEIDEAGATLVRARARAPNDAGVARDLAGVLLQGGKTSQAMAVAKDLQAQWPQSALGHAVEGDLLALSKNWREAERAYRRALKIDPEARDAAAQVYRMLFALGRQREADAFATDWIARRPSDETMRQLVADAAVRTQRFSAAIEQYEALLRANPNQPLVLSSLAAVLGQAKDPRALETAERAASLDPRNPDVLDVLGSLHLQVGDPNKGIEILQSVRELAPDRLDLRLNYAKALLRSGRKQEGLSELRELAAAPSDFQGRAEVLSLLRGI